MQPARRRLVFLSAAIAAVLAVVLPLSSPSAAGVSAAGNRVGASHPGTVLTAGLSAAVSPGQGRCQAALQPRFTAGACVAAEEGSDVVNAIGEPYPKVIDPRTGEPIPAPPSGLSKVPVGDRVPWGAQERAAFIKEWYDQGYSTPEGGWSQYDIHHIIPREYGGTNDFDNLVPVLRTAHQQELNLWWLNYGG